MRPWTWTMAGLVGVAAASGCMTIRRDALSPAAQVGGEVDRLEAEVMDDGVIAVKQPDVWGEGRMTQFRRDVEDQMRADLGRFDSVVTGRVSGADVVLVSGQIGAGGSFSGPGRSRKVDSQAVQAQATSTDGSRAGPTAADADKLLIQADPNASNLAAAKLPAEAASAGMPSLVEPVVRLDEKKRYLDHLNEIRRVNLGDDTSDSAGYGLYLIRMPVSIEPGRSTQQGWGATVAATARHEFGPDFLAETFRNLVINDLVDQLSPVIYEMIRAGGWREPLDEFEEAYRQHRSAHPDPGPLVEGQRKALSLCVQGLKLTNIPPNRLGKRSYPIAPGDLSSVFLAENFGRIARGTEAHLRTGVPRGLDVRSHLRQELESAYDLMAGDARRPGPLADEAIMGEVAELLRSRRFEGRTTAAPRPGGLPEENALSALYHRLVTRLPGNLEQRDLGALCWAIAVDSALLDRHLRQDMRRLTGTRGFAPPPSLDLLSFATPVPALEADLAFREYVRARWPLVVFALDPVADQQNIAEAASRRRDLQLAMASSLAAGLVDVHQLGKLQRRVEADAETISLNRTVSAFAMGNEHFGWRFTPRFQAPPAAAGRSRGVVESLFSGRSLATSQEGRLEAGQRELTAAVVMPSFLPRVRVEVSGRWFKLDDPSAQRPGDEVTSRRRHLAADLRRAIAASRAPDSVSAAEVGPVLARLDRVEAMLPSQTVVVDVPYENTLGGFDLFARGATALAPELVGYEGPDAIGPDGGAGILVLGKHLNVYETTVVAGGCSLASADFDVISREVLWLRMPRDLRPTVVREGEHGPVPFVEIHLATPNGISNPLLIPYSAPPGGLPVIPMPGPFTPPPSATKPPAVVDPAAQPATKSSAPPRHEHGDREPAARGRKGEVVPANDPHPAGPPPPR